MKLIYVIIGLQNEGISNVLIGRVNYLAEHTDFELHIVTEGDNNEKMLEMLDKRVFVHPLQLESLISKWRIPFLGYFSLRRKIASKYQTLFSFIQPDLITTFNLEYYAREIIPTIKFNAKKVIEFHGSYLGGNIADSYLNRNKNKETFTSYNIVKFFRKPNHRLHNEYDIATVLSNEDLIDREYLKIPIIRIYNTIEHTKAVTHYEKRDNVIVAIGRLSVEKNFKDLVLAISLISNQIGDWQVHIYGEGPEKDNLMELIHENKLDHIIKLKGLSFNMSQVYNNARLLVSTSVTEGFGRTLTEALSYNIPVISYNCKCGPKEIVSEGRNGFLIEFDVLQLASRLVQLTQNVTKLNSFSSNTRNDISKFDLQTIMQQWINLYKSVIRKRT